MLQRPKPSLLEFAFIKNKETCIDDLKSLLGKHDISISDIYHAFDLASNSKSILCYDKFLSLSNDTEAQQYASFDTGFKTDSNEPVLGWFQKSRKNGTKWTGIRFLTENSFREEITHFKMGLLCFSEFQDGPAFLNKLAERAIPETWTYKSYKSGIPHPILRSYIENTFIRLQHENKVLPDDDKKHVVFNTGLLDRFFHAIYVIADISEKTNQFLNPHLMSGVSDLAKIQFKINGSIPAKDHELPQKAVYFKDVNEVIFQESYTIDRNFEKYNHIVNERRDRFPPAYATTSSDELARALDNAISFAVKLSERNYNFIVPQYRPQDEKIQLLMPIYLAGSFTNRPDMALVLDIRSEDSLYVPETPLPLDAAYQNARLITKPAEFWLSPEKI